MESPTPVSRYIPPNSKKRVFLAGSSSSVCQEVEVLEISPPINRTSKPKSSKQKEVICHEIIDVDMEDSDELMLADGEVDLSGKGKEGLYNPSVGFSSIANAESESDTLVSNNGVSGLPDSSNVDDFTSDLFYGEDDWIDTYYDDILFDDSALLESHFDNMNIPPGVEAPFPWLPSSPGNDSKPSVSSTSNNVSSQLELDGVALAPGPSQSSFALAPIHTGELSHWGRSVTSTQLNGGNQHRKEKLPSKWMDHGQGQKKSETSGSGSTIKLGSQTSKGSFTLKYGKEVLQSLAKSKRKTRSSQGQNSIPAQFPQYVSKANGGGSYPPWITPTNAPGVGHIMPAWQDMPLNLLDPSMVSSPFMQASTFTNWAQDPANKRNGASSEGTSMPSIIENRNLDEILQNFESFKKFDTVEDYSDHHYSKNGSSARQPPKIWAKRIQEEWKILEKDLPDKIFVRIYESRMDLLRAVIIGAEGTPYHDGLFFFDVFFPSSYPNVPPHVHYHSGGLRINPNLYNCGKVCLSLLNTWSGSQEEKWIPGVSTMLQVLVSIQGLILNAKPYFNEPAYANSGGSVSGEKRSFEYNERTFIFSLQTMVYSMRRPPKYFEDFVIGHFCKHGRDILVSCKAYLDGAQVGCLVKGGVQDVDAGDKSCSLEFKNSLSEFIIILVNTFSQIGAKDCDEFLSLAHKEIEPPTTSAPNFDLVLNN